MNALLIPVTATRGRWVSYRIRLYPNQQAYQHGDELATRWAYAFTIRQDPSWLKRRIKRSLGFKSLS